MEFLEDPEGILSFEEVCSSKNFLKFSFNTPNLGLSESTYWAKIYVLNISDKDRFYFNIKQPGIDEIECFTLKYDNVNDSTIAHIYDTTSFANRFIPHPNFAVPIQIPINESRVFYFKFVTAEQLQLPLSIGTRSSIDAENHKKDLFFSFYAGLMLVMIVYNLFILISTRERTYLVYVIYVLIVFLAQMSIQGYTSLLFFDIDSLERIAVYLFGAIAPISAVYFMKSFLQLKKYSKRILYILNFGLVITFFALIIALCGFYHMSYKILQASVMFLALYQLIVAIILTVRQVPQARNFLVAWSAFWWG